MHDHDNDDNPMEINRASLSWRMFFDDKSTPATSKLSGKVGGAGIGYALRMELLSIEIRAE